MKRLSILIALVATFAVSTGALAAPDRDYAPGQNKVICDSGGNASSASTKGAKGCVLTVGDGGYAFAYLSPAAAWDKNLGTIDALSFTYSGSTPVGGSPRFSLQIDEDGAAGPNDPNANPYVFIDALNCNNGAGLVDVINDPTCLIWYGTTSYENWDAFAAAYPNATLYFAFVVVEHESTYTINNLTIGKAGARK